ncbi:MAG TPA: trans-aconitate 2-methyltransferase [Devosiaceae bacterium]|jgi:trans-aconitate 2-methyltransferase
MADWSPSAYTKFEDERTRPSRDLVAQIPLTDVRRAVDMGCGPGNSTELLVERFPGAEVIGLDSSPNMLAEARRRVPGARFETADAETWVPTEPVDVFFANAIYQWVPGHLAILPKVLEALPKGGMLAVQMPDNMKEPVHQLMREVAIDGPWAERLADAVRPSLPPVETYYDAFSPCASRLDIWHTVYNHVMADAAAVVEWVKSTGLRPFLNPLSEAEQGEFLSRYQARIDDAYKPAANGKVLLRFPRLFIAAQR